jgi:hypothetical protein
MMSMGKAIICRACSGVALILALAVSAAGRARAAVYTGIDLYTLTAPAGVSAIYTTDHMQAAGPGGQVVGHGYGSGTGNLAHALLWNGTSIATDLNPTNLAGFTNSVAYGTSGTQQVGYGNAGINNHALLWNGTAVATDLQLLLPANFASSNAYTIDASGDVFGIARDTSGATHAVEWVVPEPAGLSLLAVGGMSLLGRSCRRRRAV